MELSSLDLNFLVRELQTIAQSRIGKIYEPTPGELLIQVHSASAGKQLLRILPGQAILLAAEKAQTPMQPSNYCVRLRKLLEGGILRTIAQLGFERIVHCAINTKEGERHLYLELFGKGNVIVTDAEGIILSTMRVMAMRDRTVKAKMKYELPPARVDPRQLTAAQFAAALDSEQSVVKQLATALGLGGTIAEELCLRATMDKNTPGNALGIAAQQLYRAWREMLEATPAPHIVEQHDAAIRVLPVAFQKYPTAKPAEGMSAAIAAVLAAHAVGRSVESVGHRTIIAKLQNILTHQNKQRELLEQETVEEQRKGELIYERYAEVKTLLERLQAAFKCKQLEQEAKQHGFRIDTKRGTATIELH